MISVITTVFNAQETISETVKSVLNQSYKNFEYLIFDDGSTDNTLTKLKNFKDNRISIFKKGKTGRAKALNFCLKKAQGELIAIIDSDDIWLHKKLEIQEKIFKNNSELKLVFCNSDMINQNGRVIGSVNTQQNHNGLVKNLLKLNPPPHSSVMYSRDAAIQIGGYNEKCLKSIDFNFYLDFLKYNFKSYGVQKSLLKFRFYNNSWGRSDKNNLQLKFGILGLINFYQQQNNQIGILTNENLNWETSQKKFNDWFIKKNFNRQANAKFFLTNASSNLRSLNIVLFFKNLLKAFFEDPYFFLYKGIKFSYPRDVKCFIKCLDVE